MLRSVAAPGTPLLAACEELRRRERVAKEMLRVAKNADVGCGKSVGVMQAAERDVLRRPFADARDGAEANDALLERVGDFEEIRLVDGSARKGDDGGAARSGHPEHAEVGRKDLLRSGKGVGECGIAEGERLGRKRDQLCREAARGDDAYLLAEDGADGDLERVPAAGRAQPGLAAHDGGECAVAGEMCGDGLGVGVEIEDAAETRCDDGQSRDMIAGDLDLKRVAGGRVADGDKGDVLVDRDDAAIDAVADLFNAGDGAWSEEGEQRVPVEGWAIGEAQDKRSGGGGRDGAAAQLAGRPFVECEEGVVETADAAEARGHGDGGHGEARFVQKLLGEEHAAGLRDGQWRGTDVLIEQAAELALADAERGREPLDRRTRAVERALGDASHRAAHRVCSATPCRRVRRDLRAAAEAGAEAGLLCSGGGWKEAAVLAHRCARGTDRTAVDAGGGDTGEEAAVEARIVRLERAIADVGVEQKRIRSDSVR